MITEVNEVYMSDKDMKKIKKLMKAEYGESLAIVRGNRGHMVIDIPDGWVLVTKGPTMDGDRVYTNNNERILLTNLASCYVGRMATVVGPVIRKLKPGQAGGSYRYEGKSFPIPKGYYRVLGGKVNDGDLLFNRPSGTDPAVFRPAIGWSVGTGVAQKLCVVRKVK